MLIPWIYFLKEDEQLLIEQFTSRRVANGPGIVVVPPLVRVQRRKALTLGPTDYLRVRDTLSGEVRMELGPQLFFPSASEEVVEQLQVIPLKRNQYLRLIDRRTGVVRVERGERSVTLGPTEELLDKVREGINIDELTAVLVRDTITGGLELITKPQVFFPADQQEIVEVRKRLLLEDHETVVIKERSGVYRFRRGSDSERSFFLEPYTELLELRWSSGLHKDQRALRITRIDQRPKFMWYEFEARTQDNVELVIGITFFWQIEHVEQMIRTTDDAPGDVCSHARSMIIQSVSQVTLERFLASFNLVIRAAVLQAGDTFYTDRGVRLHAVEVRSITCKDPDTQRILQEIIQETTNRLNRIQQQESENEIRLKQIGGEIEAESMRRQLLELRRELALIEGQITGGTEAERVRAFLAGLNNEVVLNEKLALFNTLRKQEILQSLSEGKAQIYFTPADVNLSIESK
jgi:hypothetical protein